MPLCDYGCGNEGKYLLKFKIKDKWCCSERWSSCPGVRKSKSKKMKKQWNNPDSTLNTPEFRKNLSTGVKKSWNDINRRNELSEWNKKNWKDQNSFFNTEERKEKIGQVSKKYWDDPNSKFNSKEHRENLSKKVSRTIEKVKEKYPIFSTIEEMRYNPKNEGEIQVRCKNHKCKNSKEKGGWFTPTWIQFSERLRVINDGFDGSYFYCSEECKVQCPLFNKSAKQLIKEDQIRAGIIEESLYSDKEYNIWRQEVLRRDNYKCIYCDSKDKLHAHHVKPKKTDPFFVLDPENGITVCEDCHFKYCHKDKCSTGYLASLIC